MGKPIVAVSRIRGVGGMDVNLCGNVVEIMSALSALAMSIMENRCERRGFKEKEVAETLIYAVKLGIERYLEEEHGGEECAE